MSVELNSSWLARAPLADVFMRVLVDGAPVPARDRAALTQRVMRIATAPATLVRADLVFSALLLAGHLIALDCQACEAHERLPDLIDRALSIVQCPNFAREVPHLQTACMHVLVLCLVQLRGRKPREVVRRALDATHEALVAMHAAGDCTDSGRRLPAPQRHSLALALRSQNRWRLSERILYVAGALALICWASWLERVDLLLLGALAMAALLLQRGIAQTTLAYERCQSQAIQALCSPSLLNELVLLASRNESSTLE